METIRKQNEPAGGRGVYSGSRTVLTPEKSITHENCLELEKSIEMAIGQNKIDVILDCKNVELLDSAALESLLRIDYELKSRMGTLRLINVTPLCQDIMTATRINNVLLVFKDMREAMRNMT